MKRFLFAILQLLLAVPAWSQQTPPELVSEFWQVLLIQDRPMGYSHTSVHRSEENGEERLTIRQEAEYRIGRLGQAVEFSTSMSVTEDSVGRILRISSRIAKAKNPTVFHGEVRDGYLRGTTELMGRKTPVEVEWEDGVVSERGIQELTNLLIEDGEGGTATARVFDPTTQALHTVELEIGPLVELDFRGEKVACNLVWRESDLRPGVRSTSWVDGYGRLLKSSQRIAGGIQMVALLATREEALAALQSDQPLQDLFADTVVTSNRRIARPRHVDGALYRLKLRDPSLGFPDPGGDRRQEVLSRDDKAGEILLRVRRIEPDLRLSLPLVDLPAEAAAALEPSEMIQSGHPEMVAAAREAVGGETDAWAAAQKLERWVYEHIDKKSMDVALTSATKVFEERSGDCSEHAVLLAAMCRAAGIPARVVMGFEYFAGIFGGHAWTEVWVGDWCALDATNGFGWVDATHLAFLNGAFEDDDQDQGLLGLARIFGNLDVEVLELRYGERVVDVTKNEAAPEVAGGRYTDPLLGFSFELPGGWKIEIKDPQALGDGVAEIEAPDGPDRIELQVQSVPYSFTLEDLAEKIQDEGDPEPLRTTVAGLEAVRFEDPRGDGRGKTLIFFLAGDTLIGFELRWSSEESRGVLERLLDSVAFQDPAAMD